MKSSNWWDLFSGFAVLLWFVVVGYGWFTDQRIYFIPRSPASPDALVVETEPWEKTILSNGAARFSTTTNNYINGLHNRIYRITDSLSWSLTVNELVSERASFWRQKYFSERVDGTCADSIETLNVAINRIGPYTGMAPIGDTIDYRILSKPDGI